MPQIKFVGMDSKRYSQESTFLNVQAQGDYLHTLLRYNDNEEGASLDNHARWYMSLCKPVLNTAIAGNLYSLISMGKDNIGSIIRFTHVYDKKTGQVIPLAVAAAEGNTDILIGGEYIMYAIENCDPFRIVLAVIADQMPKAMNKLKLKFGIDVDVPDKSMDTFMKIVSCTRNETGNFCYGVNINLGNTEKEVQDKLFRALALRIMDKTVVRDALYLCSMSLQAARDKLKSFMLTEVMLPPVNMRPKFKRTYDAIENMFVEAYLSNMNLSNAPLTPTTIENYVGIYKQFTRNVTAYISAGARGHMSVLQHLSGKHGQIREGNLSKRMDYSARTVIVVDPHLPINTIGVPENIAKDILKHEIIKSRINDSAITVEELQDMLKQHGNVNKLTRSLRLLTKNNKDIKPGSVYVVGDDIRIAIGRQPTLHKGSISSYRMVVVDGSALRLPALICPMFNADFDGDTMHGTVAQSEAAKEEVATLLYCLNNMFWAKDGAPAITPRQEIVYGLNQCTADVDVSKAPLAFGCDTPEKAYAAVVRNRVHIYDRVSDGSTYTTVGRMAFKHCLEGTQTQLELTVASWDKYVCPCCGHEYAYTSYSGTTPKRKCPSCNEELIPIDHENVKSCPFCGKEHGVFIENNKTTIALREKLFAGNDVVQVAKSYNICVTNLRALHHIIENLPTLYASPEIFELLKSMCAVSAFNALDDVRVNCNTSVKERAASRGKLLASDIAKSISVLDDDTRHYVSNVIAKMTDLTSLVSIEDRYETERRNIPRITKDYFETMQAARLHTGIDGMSVTDYVSRYTKCEKCGYSGGYVAITSKNIKKLVNRLLCAPGLSMEGKVSFTENIRRMTELGFMVAKHYAPTLNVLTDVDVSEPSRAFHATVEKIREYYDWGYTSDESYNAAYTAALIERDKQTEKVVESELREKDNGFYKMVASGARGSLSNLVQMYAYKGQVRKSATEVCNAIIEHSYISMLNPLEHFNSANGSRSGIMDRSLATADTGYASRQMWHAANGIVVQEYDCGATIDDTILINADTVFDVIGEGGEKITEALVEAYTGRWCFINGREEFVNYNRAKELVSSNADVHIRSALTCKNPVCAKCYGIDLSTWNEVVVGTPVGIVAAEAIGETTSQLTMRTFQSGGSVKSGAISSAFDLMQRYINVRDAAGCEPVAWATGECHVNSDGVVTIYDADGAHPCPNSKYRVPANVTVKDFVTKGYGIYTIAGERNIRSMLPYRGIVGTKLYLALKLQAIYRSQCMISLKHFEVLVESMCRGLVLRSNSHEYKVGCYYTRKELAASSLPESAISWCLKPISTIPSIENDCVANIDFEAVSKGLHESILLDRTSTFEKPMESLTFGLRPRIGSEINSNYIFERTGSGTPRGNAKDYSHPRGDMLH